MEKITAIIPTYNEESRIRKSLESVLWADEVIVVDSFSTDATSEIVREYGSVKFIQHEFVSHAAQKNWVIPQAENEWIFILDADEWITKAGEAEIRKLVNSHPKEAAFRFRRSNYFMGRTVNHVWKGDSVIRLIRKSLCKYKEVHVHEEITANGEVGWAENVIFHDTYAGKGYDAFVLKSLRYSTLSARDRIAKAGRITGYHLFVKPGFTFFKHYIFKRGFLDGKAGFILSCLNAWYVFQRSVKIWRMKEGEELKDI